MRRKRRTEAAVRGTQVYKYSPHLAPGEEDQVEATSEEKEEDRGHHPWDTGI